MRHQGGSAVLRVHVHLLITAVAAVHNDII